MEENPHLIWAAPFADSVANPLGSEGKKRTLTWSFNAAGSQTHGLTGSQANPICLPLIRERDKKDSQIIGTARKRGFRVLGAMLAASHAHGLAGEAYARLLNQLF